jgi:hypothetical protein
MKQTKKPAQEPYADLISRAKTLLGYDFQEANEVVESTISDLIKALRKEAAKGNKHGR